MINKNYVYRELNPYSDEDMKKYFHFKDKLDDELSANIQPMTDEQIMWQRTRLGAYKLLPDYDENKKYDEIHEEYIFLCELNNEVVGYVCCCTYHVENGKYQEDDTGLIAEIFVDKNNRDGYIAYNLLQMAIDILIKANKKQAIMLVQEDNPSRYLHFALADKLISSKTVKRKNGSETTDYKLLITDISRIKNLSLRDIAKKALSIKKQQVENTK